MDEISLIITAGGTSSRYGKENKLLEKVYGKTVIEYTLEKFLAIEDINEIVITANISIINSVKKLFEKYSKIKVIQGGETRQESVYNGLKILSHPDYVLIHDGARPLVDILDIRKLIEKMKNYNSAILAVKTIDTIKKVDEKGKIISTVNRSNLYNVQTPQGFKYELIYDAHKKLEGQNYTDDAGMLEALGQDVYIVEGNYNNFKITTKIDISKMEAVLNV